MRPLSEKGFLFFSFPRPKPRRGRAGSIFSFFFPPPVRSMVSPFSFVMKRTKTASFCRCGCPLLFPGGLRIPPHFFICAFLHRVGFFSLFPRKVDFPSMGDEGLFYCSIFFSPKAFGWDPPPPLPVEGYHLPPPPSLGWFECACVFFFAVQRSRLFFFLLISGRSRSSTTLPFGLRLRAVSFFPGISPPRCLCFEPADSACGQFFFFSPSGGRRANFFSFFCVVSPLHSTQPADTWVFGPPLLNKEVLSSSSPPPPGNLKKGGGGVPFVPRGGPPGRCAFSGNTFFFDYGVAMLCSSFFFQVGGMLGLSLSSPLLSFAWSLRRSAFLFLAAWLFFPFFSFRERAVSVQLRPFFPLPHHRPTFPVFSPPFIALFFFGTFLFSLPRSTSGHAECFSFPD